MKPNFDTPEQECYLDSAATTPIDPAVVDDMMPYLQERYGNAEAPYHVGDRCLAAVDVARQKVADCLGCSPGEVFFTSGGTEANNWAVKCVPGSGVKSGRLVSAVEHSSVLESARWWSGRNADGSFAELPVDQSGAVDPAALDKELSGGHYSAVSIQYGNNEVGTLQPVAAIAEVCKKRGVLFHCDAVQAFGRVAFKVGDVGADMMSLSAHKIHGPGGVGALYIRKGAVVEPLLHGGGQESGMRSGTLAVPLIVGFGRAAELARVSIREDMPRIFKMVDNLVVDMDNTMKVKRNGDPKNRLPHILSVTLPGQSASLILGLLAKDGICVSLGSACGRGKSHVLRAMGMEDSCGSTLRVSLSRFTTQSQCAYFLSRLQRAVRMSASVSVDL